MNGHRSIQVVFARALGAAVLGLATVVAACSVATDPEALGADEEALASCPGSPGACAEHAYPFWLGPVSAGNSAVALATTPEVYPAGSGWESAPPSPLLPSTCAKGDRVCELEGLLNQLGCSAGGDPATKVRTYAHMNTGAYCTNFFLWARCPAASTKRLRELAATTAFGGDTCPGVYFRIDFYYADPPKSGGAPTIYCPTAAAQAGKCAAWPGTTPDPSWKAVVDWDPLCPGACVSGLPVASPVTRTPIPAPAPTVVNPAP